MDLDSHAMASPQRGQAASETIDVAVLDRNPTVRRGLETIVSLDPGCRCVGSWSDWEDVFPALPGLAPDVVLVDIQLLDGSGIGHAARLRAQWPATQIVAVTVYEDPDPIHQALRAGACGYLLKRATPVQIIAAIRKAHHTPCHPNHTCLPAPGKPTQLGS